MFTSHHNAINDEKNFCQTDRLRVESRFFDKGNAREWWKSDRRQDVMKVYLINIDGLCVIVLHSHHVSRNVIFALELHVSTYASAWYTRRHFTPLVLRMNAIYVLMRIRMLYLSERRHVNFCKAICFATATISILKTHRTPQRSW